MQAQGAENAPGKIRRHIHTLRRAAGHEGLVNLVPHTVQGGGRHTENDDPKRPPPAPCP